MTEGSQAARRQLRAPLRQRSRRRWAVIGGVAAAWVVLEVVAGSAVSATVLLVAIAGLGAGCVGGLRALGITRDHPWIRRLASRPWRDGQDLPDVWYADAPEFAHATPQHGYAGPGRRVWSGPDPGLTVAGGMTTIRAESLAPVPVLRLVTGSSVAQTTMSGARAGRGPVELVLPDVPTVSREHARFTFSDGRWWITNQGRNGLTLNGAAVAGEQSLSDGDAIRWGTRTDALRSRVEIG
jgi:FHA domain-containing protein